MQVHAAHEGGLIPRHRVERAVPDQEDAALEAWFVPLSASIAVMSSSGERDLIKLADIADALARGSSAVASSPARHASSSTWR